MALSFYGGSIVSASLREALAGNAKTNVYAVMVQLLLHIYINILDVRLPVCHVKKLKF